MFRKHSMQTALAWFVAGAALAVSLRLEAQDPEPALLDSSWTLTAGGQTVNVDGDGSFEIPNIDGETAYEVKFTRDKKAPKKFVKASGPKQM